MQEILTNVDITTDINIGIWHTISTIIKIA